MPSVVLHHKHITLTYIVCSATAIFVDKLSIELLRHISFENLSEVQDFLIMASEEIRRLTTVRLLLFELLQNFLLPPFFGCSMCFPECVAEGFPF